MNTLEPREVFLARLTTAKAMPKNTFTQAEARYWAVSRVHDEIIRQIDAEETAADYRRLSIYCRRLDEVSDAIDAAYDDLEAVA